MDYLCERKNIRTNTIKIMGANISISDYTEVAEK